MKRTTWTLAAVVAALTAAPAQAQNTYADFPFHQGSLFYRYSGARPPQTTSRRPQAVPRYTDPPRSPAASYPYTRQASTWLPARLP